MLKLPNAEVAGVCSLKITSACASWPSYIKIHRQSFIYYVTILIIIIMM